ncbi:hypothetical protein HYH02_013175 [Chlamydomonas schloesseri]|uniref:Uncharacterized protein n=1 Tax=Chlamydomonas schloesseri TaxID=2026947 RepID=A0A835SUU5_9CHLO|nr:hypothetical protein HYH02_013175 [Chlamydomonas schloesseri]|eukprot:KAG2431957.1 hypothetical protein HYH02_013175 [Chlamydomonas schloesseri]
MPQVLRGDIIESEELAELRDEVLAKLLPAPPRRAQPDEVLAHARAEAHQQAAVFNDSRLAHLQLIHQQHNSLARLQYGDAEADLREAAEAAEVRAQQAAQRTLELIREQEEEDRKARALLAARCSVDSTLHTGVGVSVGAEAACAGSDGAAVRASVGSGRSAKGVKLHASSMAACAAEAPAEITMSRYIVAPAPARFLTTQPPPPPPSQPQEAAPGGAGTGAGGAAAPGAAGPHATHAFYAGSRHASFGRRNSGGSGGMAWHGAPLELPGGGAAVNAPASGGAGGRFVSAVSPWPAELPPSTHGIGAATFSPAAMRSPAPSMRRRSSAADFLLDSVPEVAAMAAKGSGAPSPMLQHLLQNPHQHQQYALHPTPPPPVYLHSGSMAAAATGSGCPSPAPGSATAAGFRSAGTPLAAAHTNSGRGLQHWGSDRQRFGSTSALMAATVAGVVSKAAVAAAQSEAEAEFAADADADVQAAFGGGSEMNTGQSSELDAVVAQVELLQQQRATLHTPPPHQARIHSRPQSHPHQMQAQQGLVGTLASSGCGSASGKRAHQPPLLAAVAAPAAAAALAATTCSCAAAARRQS